MSSSRSHLLPALSNNIPIALIHPFISEQTLVVHNGNPISQRQFLLDLHRLAGKLPQGRFALNLCEDRYYFLLAFCALLINNAINLLPPNRQPATLIELGQNYPDCYCLFDTDQPCELPALNLHDLLQVPSSENSTTQYELLPYIPAQQIAAIAFTSGSTGKPTPNKKSWGTLAATARLLGQRLTAHLTLPTMIATVPSQHMYGLETTLMMALQASVIMHSAKPFFPADIQSLLLQIDSTPILVSAPVHLRAIINAEISMPQLAGIISATAPLDKQIALASEHCFASPLWEIYGCTEAGSMATRRTTQTDFWQLLDGFQLTETEQRNVSVSAPHLKESALLQDQLEFNSAGDFLLSGRNTDIINVAGKRSSLAHLTLQLLRIDGVRDGVIFLPQKSIAHSPSKEQRPAAFVVSDLSEKQIHTALAQLIDAAFLPRPIRKVDSLPRNELGKLTALALNNLWSSFSDKH